MGERFLVYDRHFIKEFDIVGNCYLLVELVSQLGYVSIVFFCCLTIKGTYLFS